MVCSDPSPQCPHFRHHSGNSFSSQAEEGGLSSRLGSHLPSSGKLGLAVLPSCTHHAFICHRERMSRFYGFTSCPIVGKYHLYLSLAGWVVSTLLVGKKSTLLMPPLISIVIVLWNSAKHLPRCLDCLSLQTVQDFEVILIDNGSLDG